MARVIVEDQSLRDGLQFEPKVLRLEDKRTLFRLLAAAGLKRLQVGSFVHPTIVPQMADTDEFVRTVKNEAPGVLVTALVLNDKGLERALACGIGHLSMSSSASDSHSLKNVKALCKVVDAYEALLERPLPGRMNRVLKAQGDCHLTSTHAHAGKDQDR